MMRRQEKTNSGAADGGLQIRDRIREFRRIKGRELIPNPKNWRRHPKAQSDALRGLLMEIGFADALLVRELPDGRFMLVDGHLRAATTPDMEVPVLIVDLTEAEADKLLLTLDPLACLAQADSERVADLLSTVSSDDDGVRALLGMIGEQHSATFVEPDELIDPEPRTDKAAELTAKWKTRVGQLWQAGPHRLLCADCRNPSQVSRLWADGGRFRVLWTDPPYGVNYAGKNELLNKSDTGRAGCRAYGRANVEPWRGLQLNALSNETLADIAWSVSETFAWGLAVQRGLNGGIR